MNFLSPKKLLLLGFIVVLLIVIPLTVYLVQQQQKIRVGAAPSSTLSLLPATFSTTVGQTFNLKVSVNPGTNEISFVKLVINFDSTKLSVSSSCLSINQTAFPVTLQAPNCSAGTITATLSINTQNPPIKSPTEVATLTFKAENSTTTPTKVTFDKGTPQNPQTQVLSVASADQFNENVLLNANGSDITINPSGVSPSPSPSPSPGAGGTGLPNQVPLCTSFNVDRSTTGTAPYSITFTVVGNDPDGTISKVTFNFGDGPQVDETTGGGIGTKTVNLPKAHTYQNAGTYTALATLTDNNGGVSIASSCTKTITVTSVSGGVSGGVSQGGTGTTISAQVSPTPVAGTPTPTPGLPTKGGLPTVGPGDTIISVGAVGAILTILGVFLLFAL